MPDRFNEMARELLGGPPERVRRIADALRRADRERAEATLAMLDAERQRACAAADWAEATCLQRMIAAIRATIPKEPTDDQPKDD